MTQSPSPSINEVAERREALLTIIRDAVVNVAQRHALRRGPYILDEAELQGLASEIAATAAALVSPPKAGSGEAVGDFPQHDFTGRVEVPSITSDRTSPNHEARGDGVRVTNEMVERARRAILKCRFYDPEPHMYDGEDAFFAYIATTDHWPEAEDESRDALEAALPPLGDGRAEIIAECIAAVEKARSNVIHSGSADYVNGVSLGHSRAIAAIRSLSNPGGSE